MTTILGLIAKDFLLSLQSFLAMVWWKNWDGNWSKATHLANTMTSTQAECLPLNPILVVPPCASLQLGVLNITLSEAGCLRTLGSLEPKSHCIQLPQTHTAIHSLPGRNLQGFFGTISFLPILTLVPFPATSAWFFQLLSLIAQTLRLRELPQLQQCWHQAQGHKPIRVYQLRVLSVSHPWCWHLSSPCSLTSWELAHRRVTAVIQHRQKLFGQGSFPPSLRKAILSFPDPHLAL